MTAATDRELLDLAAKAAGYQVDEHVESGAWCFISGSPLNSDGEESIFLWNPLSSDGDALRLAVRLGQSLRIQSKTSPRIATSIVGGWKGHSTLGVPHRGDPYAATRRAIVMAAAEIGRQMP